VINFCQFLITHKYPKKFPQVPKTNTNNPTNIIDIPPINSELSVEEYRKISDNISINPIKTLELCKLFSALNFFFQAVLLTKNPPVVKAIPKIKQSIEEYSFFNIKIKA
jgi:hypothetical protein